MLLVPVRDGGSPRATASHGHPAAGQRSCSGPARVAQHDHTGALDPPPTPCNHSPARSSLGPDDIRAEKSTFASEKWHGSLGGTKTRGRRTENDQTNRLSLEPRHDTNPPLSTSTALLSPLSPNRVREGPHPRLYTHASINTTRLPLPQQHQNKPSYTKNTRDPTSSRRTTSSTTSRCACATPISAPASEGRICSRPQRRENRWAAVLTSPALYSGLCLATVRRLQHLHVVRVHRVALAIQSDAKATAVRLRVRTRRVPRLVPIRPGCPPRRRRAARHHPRWPPPRFGAPPQRAAGVKGSRPITVSAAETLASLTATTSNTTIRGLPRRRRHARDRGGSAPWRRRQGVGLRAHDASTVATRREGARKVGRLGRACGSQRGAIGRGGEGCRLRMQWQGRRGGRQQRTGKCAGHREVVGGGWRGDGMPRRQKYRCPGMQQAD